MEVQTIHNRESPAMHQPYSSEFSSNGVYSVKACNWLIFNSSFILFFQRICFIAITNNLKMSNYPCSIFVSNMLILYLMYCWSHVSRIVVQTWALKNILPWSMGLHCHMGKKRLIIHLKCSNTYNCVLS